MKKIVYLACVLFLVACGSESNDVQSKQVAQKNDKKNHILSEHERAMQKAKEVEKELKKADDKRRKVLDDNG